MEFTAIDLFSGCGGLTLGLKLAGFKVIGAIDNNALCIETYSANHPEVHLWENDIRTLTANELKTSLGLDSRKLDLLAGCPPCQGFSSIRTLNGSKRVNDHAKNLVFDFYRFVEELLPRVVMLENVPGLVKDRRFRIFIHSIKTLGYTCNYAILNTANYGVPQRRRRLLLVASLYGAMSFAPQESKKYTVRDAIGNLPIPRNSRDPLHNMTESRSEKVARIIEQIPHDGGSRSSLGKRSQLKCHKTTTGFKDIYGRMSWDSVSPTITGGCFNPSKGRFLHPVSNRAITLREAAILQSFPPNYFFSLARGKIAAAALIGNALPPEFVKRHAAQIKCHLECSVGV